MTGDAWRSHAHCYVCGRRAYKEADKKALPAAAGDPHDIVCQCPDSKWVHESCGGQLRKSASKKRQVDPPRPPPRTTRHSQPQPEPEPRRQFRGGGWSLHDGLTDPSTGFWKPPETSGPGHRGEAADRPLPPRPRPTLPPHPPPRHAAPRSHLPRSVDLLPTPRSRPHPLPPSMRRGLRDICSAACARASRRLRHAR